MNGVAIFRREECWGWLASEKEIESQIGLKETVVRFKPGVQREGCSIFKIHTRAKVPPNPRNPEIKGAKSSKGPQQLGLVGGGGARGGV